MLVDDKMLSFLFLVHYRIDAVPYGYNSLEMNATSPKSVPDDSM
jgi:hypothetical protein